MKWPFKKVKILFLADHLLDKTFQMMYSNLGLSFRWTLPLRKLDFFVGCTYTHVSIKESSSAPGDLQCPLHIFSLFYAYTDGVLCEGKFHEPNFVKCTLFPMG